MFFYGIVFAFPTWANICSRTLEIQQIIIGEIRKDICSNESEAKCSAVKSLSCERVERKFLQRVESLTLSDISLKSGDLQGLLNLKSLFVRGIDLTDFSLQELAQESPDLLEFVLAYNKLGKNKTLSPELGKLTKLQSLWIGGNGFEGPLPEEMGNLVNLKFLDIDESKIEGPVPESFRELTKLLRVGLVSAGDKWVDLGGISKDIRTFLRSGNRRQECRLFNEGGREVLKKVADELMSAVPATLRGNLILDENFTHFSIHENTYGKDTPATGPYEFFYEMPFFRGLFFQGLGLNSKKKEAKVHFRLTSKNGEKDIYVNCKAQYHVEDRPGQTRVAKQYRSKRGRIILRECRDNLKMPAFASEHSHGTSFDLPPQGLGEESDGECAQLGRQQSRAEVDDSNRGRSGKPQFQTSDDTRTGGDGATTGR